MKYFGVPTSTVTAIHSFFDYFACFKRNRKISEDPWHSLTHIFTNSQATVLICQGNTFRCGR